ncbi:hypothetical protein [Agathobaculum sp. Marseille-P7918]|uniref:hypothetical protein n=1 Tax=Agathobaculum sp. Marseille-P7918 TaxID=2479843 RepID=UPI003565244B
MEDELLSTFTIEQFDTSQDSVRKILSGYAPTSESENRIYGMKKGLEFIGNPRHTISTETFQNALAQGDVTEKEQALWQFLLTSYGNGQFSTKQLEKDFGNAAYATIRGFVLKFENLGLLRSAKYGNRIKYQIAD